MAKTAVRETVDEDIEGRLERWIAALGKPWGGARANPDNDTYYLLKDALAEIRRLRKGAK